MYYLLILAVGIERLIELLVAKRNARWAFSHGGKEFGHDHYPVMVTLHTALLLGCVIEVWALHRPFIGWLGWPMLAVVAASQVLRWWCVATLGRRWNTLVIVLPEAPVGTTRSVPVAAPPELCGSRRRGGRAASGAHGMVDRDRFHVGQRAAADGTDQDRELGTGLRMTRRRRCRAMRRSGADDIRRRPADRRRRPGRSRFGDKRSPTRAFGDRGGTARRVRSTRPAARA